ncbi:MAG: N-acetyltransferase [Bacteroidetes bacterium CHB5]|nr:N-acetyltransferase [Bacteroidetes bacterium CHB5]
MTIKQIEQGSKGSFILDENGERLGEMTYTVAGELIIIDHTEVSDKLRGQGAGKKLVLAAVEYARQNKIKVLPICPFAKVTFDRTPDIQDVVSK